MSRAVSNAALALPTDKGDLFEIADMPAPADGTKGRSTRWTKPSPSYAIDRFVEGLVSGNYAERWSLSPDLQDDPWLIARCFLGRAVEVAKNADRKEEVRRRTQVPQNLLAEISELETAMRVIMSSNLAAKLAVITPRTESIDPETEFPISEFTGPIEKAKMYLAKALASGEAARKVVGERPRPKQSGAKTFETSFGEEMIYAWVRLTGKIPGPADKIFQRFCEEAFRTLQSTTPAALGLPFYVRRWDVAEMGRKHEAISQTDGGWGPQIRVALEGMSKRGIKDRADRYKNGYPDGIGAQPLPEGSCRGFVDGVPAIDDQETLRLISVMNAGGEAGRGAASVLWTEFDIGGERRKKRYLDLGFALGDAVAVLGRPGLSSPAFVWRVTVEGGGGFSFIAPMPRAFGPSFAPDDD
jgi:hypothetical protein